jgi:hypothetical protein
MAPTLPSGRACRPISIYLSAEEDPHHRPVDVDVSCAYTTARLSYLALPSIPWVQVTDKP